MKSKDGIEWLYDPKNMGGWLTIKQLERYTDKLLKE